MSTKRKFNPELRKRLEFDIRNGMTITDIAIILGASRRTVYTEPGFGLSDEDKEKKLWMNYSAELAQKNYEKQVLERLRK